MAHVVAQTLNRHKAIEQATDTRLQLLKNGYLPLPAKEKMVVMKGWPQIQPDEYMIREWSSWMDYRTTAIRLDGDLVAIDIDVDDEEMADLIFHELATLSNAADFAPMRFGKGSKIMLLCRCVDEQVGIIHSKLMVDGDGKQHRVEVFGSGSPRYFTCYGPHTEGEVTAEGVEVLVKYRWDDEVDDPTTVAVDDLPVVARDTLVAFCLKASERMAEMGWEPVAKSNEGIVTERKVADIPEDAAFDLQIGETIPLSRLHEYEGERCSASWMGDPTFANTSRCMIGVDHEGVPYVLDFDTYVQHYPEDADTRPKREKDDEKQRDKASRLGAALEEKMPDQIDRSEVDFNVNDLALEDGRELHEWEFVDWLLARFAWFGAGTGAERVVDMVTGAGYAREGFNGMWVNKSWKEETGEEYQKGPRKGEPKVEKVTPTAVWFVHSNRVSIDGYKFDPAREERLIYDDGLWLNVYRAPEEIYARADQDGYVWWCDFIEHLLPEEKERRFFENWLRYKWRNPDARGQAVVMVSPTGDAGRGVLFRILEAVFQNHVAKPAASDLTGMSGQAVFNDWVDGTVLALVDELMLDAGSYKEKIKAYETLKDMVDPLPKRIMVNGKGKSRRPAISYMSLITATNNSDALPIPESDRRFTILSNGDKLSERPDLLRELDALQNNRGEMLESFRAAVVEWLEEDEVDRQLFLQPMMTDAKMDMIENAEGAIEQVLGVILARRAEKKLWHLWFADLVTAVETELKALGKKQEMVDAAQSSVRRALERGFKGWRYTPRKQFKVVTDVVTGVVTSGEVTISRGVVAHRDVFETYYSVEDRSAELAIPVR